MPPVALAQALKTGFEYRGRELNLKWHNARADSSAPEAPTAPTRKSVGCGRVACVLQWRSADHVCSFASEATTRKVVATTKRVDGSEQTDDGSVSFSAEARVHVSVFPFCVCVTALT